MTSLVQCCGSIRINLFYAQNAGFKALMEQYDLAIREDEVLLGTLKGCYPKVEVPDYQTRKEEARGVVQNIWMRNRHRAKGMIQDAA